MPASELFRFRTVRQVQNKQVGFSALAVTSSLQYANKVLISLLEQGIETFLGTYAWLQQVSEELAAASDEVAPAALITMLPADWTTEVAGWAPLQQQLADVLASLALQVMSVNADPANYGIPVIPSSLTELIELVTRIILVQDCITTLAADQTVPAAQKQLQSADDVRVALSFRTVALPTTYFSNTPPVLARAPGVTDLSVVNDEWNRYIPGELANVVNVLPGETFNTGSRHMEETVQTQSTTDQTTTTQTTANSQTSSSTLAATSANTASTNIGVHGQVETTGQYGPTQVKTNIGGQAQISISSARSTALTTSVETVAESVKTVSETITQAQSTKTTIKDKSHEEHNLQNQGTAVVVGLYRWLSEIHRVQLVSYPNRFIVEFEIPEPGAWLRWALNNQPDLPWDNPDPGPFNNPNTGNPLQPTDLTAAMVSTLAAQWRVQGLTPPPAASVTIGNSYNFNNQSGAPQNGTNIVVDNSMTVPTGYEADSWSADVWFGGGGDSQHTTDVHVGVGANSADTTLPGAGGTTITDSQLSGALNGLTGTIPIYLSGFYALGASCNITVTCNQIGGANGLPFQQWQFSTFDTIASAYDDLLSAHNQERDARAQQQTGPMIIGPPALNLSRSVAELKRLAIQNLLGQPFTGYDLLTIGPASSIPSLGSGEPGLIPANTVAASPVIQFFEQAFEWENIVYICYPYFWGGHERWVVNATSASADPVFDQFLNAGSVRLVVPARPGFESLVNFFLYTSSVWAGKNPPGPNDPDYLSVADEIQSIQVGATDGTPIEPPWEITLPTTLLWAGTDPTTLPTNPNPTIGPPPPAQTGTVSVAVTSLVNPSVYGQPVTFTAVVSAVTAGAATPTGQVNFLIDGNLTPDSPAPLDGTGTATSVAVTTLTTGTHSVTVNYLGDDNFPTATGALTTQTVSTATTTLALSSLANPSVSGQFVTFTAVVTATAPGGGTPTGQVNFLIDGNLTPGSPATLDTTGKTTTAAISTLTVGTHTVTANYMGDGNFATGSGSLPTQTVNKAAVTVAVASSVNPSTRRQSVTFTATVTAAAPGLGTPTGSVNFLVDGKATADSPVPLTPAGTAAAKAITTLTKGPHTVTVNYLGDGNFATGTGSLPTQTVS
jgi:hypothetical protein